MRRAERKRLAQLLATPRYQFRLFDPMLIATPIERILRGIFIENSSDPQRVYLWAFVQPLFSPSTNVVLSLGQRLGGGSRTWSVADAERAAAELVDEAVQFFGPISSAAALACWKLLEARRDEYGREARAYALVAAGRYEEGSQELHALAASLPAVGPTWMAAMKKRAEDLARRAESDGDAAQQLLREWEFESRAALRISEVP
jgi:hypothetical protein